MPWIDKERATAGCRTQDSCPESPHWRCLAAGGSGGDKQAVPGRNGLEVISSQALRRHSGQAEIRPGCDNAMNCMFPAIITLLLPATQRRTTRNIYRTFGNGPTHLWGALSVRRYEHRNQNTRSSSSSSGISSVKSAHDAKRCFQSACHGAWRRVTNP